MEKHRLSAIMFTDIVGYSRKMEADEVGMLRLLDEHIKMVEPAAARHEGEIIKRVGDAFLISFDSAINAVRCALDIQESHRTFNSDKPESDQVLLRIGIHLGDIVIREGDVFGDSVNVAARVQPLAEPGGICITRAVYDIVRKKMEINVVELGPQQLKNVEEAVEVFHLLSGTVSGRSLRRTRHKLRLKRRAATIAGMAILAMMAAAALSHWGLFGDAIKDKASELMTRVFAPWGGNIPADFSNYELRNDGASVALMNERGGLFKVISAPPGNLFNSVTIVEPAGREKVKCLLTTHSLQSGLGHLICLDVKANVVLMDSILESDVPLKSVHIGPALGVIDYSPENESWTRQSGYDCDGAWVADLDGNEREIIALFYNTGWFARCLRIYRNSVNGRPIMSIWHPGMIQVRGFWDVSGDSAKEILCTGSLNWKQDPHLVAVFCLKLASGEAQTPAVDHNTNVYNEHGIVSSGWGSLQWYDLIPFPARQDSGFLNGFYMNTFACSDRTTGKDAELVVITSDGRVYLIDGNGEQISLSLSDFGQSKYRGRQFQADIIRMSADNVDSLLAGWFDERLYLKFVD